jgi:preprotein translocase subunit SecA
MFPHTLTAEDVADSAGDRDLITDRLQQEAAQLYDAREAELGEELMRSLERFLLLQILDEQWREHLYDMDYLREGIGLRGFAQVDPLIEYKNEAYTLFTDLMNNVWSSFSRLILMVQVTVNNDGQGPAPAQQQTAPAPFNPSSSSTRPANVTYSGGGMAQPSALAAAAAAAGPGGAYAGAAAAEAGEPVVTQRRVADDEQIGRNDPCWCGSGKKYKKCHGA